MFGNSKCVVQRSWVMWSIFLHQIAFIAIQEDQENHRLWIEWFNFVLQNARGSFWYDWAIIVRRSLTAHFSFEEVEVHKNPVEEVWLDCPTYCFFMVCVIGLLTV